MLSTKNASALIDGAPLENTKGKTMVKIKLIRNTVAGGKPRQVKDVVTVSKDEARYLIAIKKALPVGDKSPKVENREKDIETSKRGKKG